MNREDRTRAELTRTRAELMALLAVSQTLRASRDLPAVYRVVGSQLANVIAFDSFFIGVYLPESRAIRFEYSVDEGQIDDEQNTVPLDQAHLSARIIVGRRTINIADLDEHRQRHETALLSFGNTQKRSRSWLGAPMISGDEIFGVLALQSYNVGAFTEADGELLLLLASQVSIAVENARLVERLKRTIAELSTPLLSVAEGVLVLPLFGSIDGERAEKVLEQTLQIAMERQADMLVIDITGVLCVDGFVVEQVLKIVRTAALVGTRSCVVGINPTIARTAAALGLDVLSLQMFHDLRSALATIFAGKQRTVQCG